MKGSFLIYTIKDMFSEYIVNDNDIITYGIVTISYESHEIFRVYCYGGYTEDCIWYISFSDFTRSFKIPENNTIEVLEEVREISNDMKYIHSKNDEICEKIDTLSKSETRLTYFRNKKLDNLL